MDSQHAIYPILFILCAMFVGAKVAGRLLERIGQPAIIGELLVGVALGPSLLGWVVIPVGGDALQAAIADPARAFVWQVFAELGAIVLLFMVGLETGLRDLLRVGKAAFVVAVFGVVAPLAAGYALMRSLGHPTPEALFVGAAMVATSVGITARVLSDLRALQTAAARIILGAAVIDDILGILVLAVVVRMVAGTVSEPGALTRAVGLLTLQVLLFTVLVTVVGTWLIRRYRDQVHRLPMRDAPFVLAIGLLLAVAGLAAWFGMAAIIGAFFAGIVIHDISEEYELEARLKPLYEFLVPMFFVIMGAQVRVQQLADWSLLGVGLALAAVAIVTKLIPCALGAVGENWRTRALVGVGMTPRGEVGIIVAAIALTRGVIGPALYGQVILMVLVTTLAAPPVLRWMLRRSPEPTASVGALAN